MMQFVGSLSSLFRATRFGPPPRFNEEGGGIKLGLCLVPLAQFKPLYFTGSGFRKLRAKTHLARALVCWQP